MLRACLAAVALVLVVVAFSGGAEPTSRPAGQQSEIDRMKAEMERLKREAEVERMKAEVERMRRELEEMRRRGGNPADPQPNPNPPNPNPNPGVAPQPDPAGPRIRIAPDPGGETTPRQPPRPDPRAGPVAPPIRIAPPQQQETIPETPFAVGQRPALRPARMPSNGVTDKEIGDSITRAAEFLMAQIFDGSGNMRIKLNVPAGSPAFPDTNDPSLNTGMQTLCVYALMQAGMGMNDERLNIKSRYMKQLVDNMRKLPADGGASTYVRGLRSTALSVYNRQEDRKVLTDDVNYLLENVHGGCYTYGTFSQKYGNGDKSRRFGDNSNAQYGLLGVWSGAEVGAEVPQGYWHMVENHWIEAQHDNGQWGYTPNLTTPSAAGMAPPTGNPPQMVGPDGTKGTLSMTLAGVASMFVTHDYLHAAAFGKEVGRPPFSPPLARGLKWLETGDNLITGIGAGHGGWGGGYVLYGIERVGLASGFKYIGKHEWYRTLAGWLIERQQQDGSFGDPIETAYCLLFLARGRHPIIMNKVRFEGSWANRPRDLANLGRFASRELERPLNWQVVPLERDWTDWTDSPVLYIASHEKLKLLEGDYSNLRSFVDAGGLIFTQSDGNNPAFNVFVQQLGKKLFPYEWTDLPIDHEIYSVQFKVSPKPRLRCISNGSRILMLHSTEDIAANWQTRAEKTRRNMFDLGVNIFLYAAGKTDLRNRLSGSHLPQPLVNPTSRMPVARIKYAGNWNPEPFAWERFSRFLQYQTGVGLLVSSVPAAELSAAKHPVAHLTGTVAYRPGDAELAAIKKYVEDGGVLLIDACGGSGPFDQAIRSSLIEKAFAGAKPEPIPPTHRILAGGANGMENLTKPEIRTVVMQKMSRASARVMMLRAGKGCVIYSPLDLTTGILGARTYNILGYQPAYASSLVKNIMLWIWDGQPQ